MAEDFDLFGQPIVDISRGKGRPPYQVTERNRNKIKLLLALGWSIQRMAHAVGASPATLKRHFRAEMKERDAMRDRMEARRLEIAWDQASTGNVGAMREFGRLLDRNDRMEIERMMGSDPKLGETKAERPGKKIIDEQRARDADDDLMAELEREASQHALHS